MFFFLSRLISLYEKIRKKLQFFTVSYVKKDEKVFFIL